MADVDFLPIAYRQQHAQRRLKPWRLIVLLSFAALLGAAALAGFQRRHRLEAELEAIRPLEETAAARLAQLADVQSRWRTARAESELYTYLRHPWPRTQILAALLAPLPDEIMLEQLQIHPEAPAGRAPVAARPDAKTEQEQQARLPAAARDLKRLRAELDPPQTVALLTGVTAESAALHRYLTELGKSALLAKVQLRSIETLKADRGTGVRFSAAIIVRPGYGQPGGPVPEKTAAVQNREAVHGLDSSRHTPCAVRAGVPVLEQSRVKTAPGQIVPRRTAHGVCLLLVPAQDASHDPTVPRRTGQP